jgi:ABC-type xylose transport system permease subunit
MNYSADPLEKRLQISGILLILGLLTEALCLFWARPLSFLAFIGVGGALLFLGVGVYLLSLVSIKPTSHRTD